MERRPAEPLTELGRLTDRGWLVGGAVRDHLLGRATMDFDVAVDLPPTELRPLARGLARATGGFSFSLSEAFGAWRVMGRERDWQLDLMPLEGGSIEADLLRRDLTINAIAEPLARPGELIDPHGGREDLAARRLRAVTPTSFTADPVRVMRLARLAAELGFEVDPETSSLAREAAAELEHVAPERLFTELRLVLSGERPLAGLSVMDAVGATRAVIPELGALQGIEQSRFHHLDVLGHTRAVLTETLALERDPEAVFGADGTALDQFMTAPLANELNRWQALRFGALLHDIAKPLTRAQTPEGRITFMRHDETGAELAGTILERLRASERLIQYVVALTRHHLRLGFLVHAQPLGRRDVYRYLKASDGVPVDVTVLSVADRLATRGDDSERAIARHLDLARRMLPEALAWSAQRPRPPLRGDELSAALGLQPGPRLGALLGELEEAAYAGEVRSAQEAIGYARRRLAAGEA